MIKIHARKTQASAVEKIPKDQPTKGLTLGAIIA